MSVFLDALEAHFTYGRAKWRIWRDASRWTLHRPNPALELIDQALQHADSPVYHEAMWSWWTDVAQIRLPPGAPVVLILTRWHEDDSPADSSPPKNGHTWQVLRI